MLLALYLTGAVVAFVLLRFADLHDVPGWDDAARSTVAAVAMSLLWPIGVLMGLTVLTVLVLGRWPARSAPGRAAPAPPPSDRA